MDRVRRGGFVTGGRRGDRRVARRRGGWRIAHTIGARGHRTRGSDIGRGGARPVRTGPGRCRAECYAAFSASSLEGWGFPFIEHIPREYSVAQLNALVRSCGRLPGISISSHGGGCQLTWW